MDIIEMASSALAVARREGATQAEAFTVASVTKSVYVDDDRIKIVEEKGDQGLAVRVLKGRKLAQASSACASREDAEACARAAASLADRSPASRAYDSFPRPEKAVLSPPPRDGRIADLDVSVLVEMAKATVGAANDRGTKVPRGVLRVASTMMAIMNTNGLEVINRGTLVLRATTPWPKDLRREKASAISTLHGSGTTTRYGWGRTLPARHCRQGRQGLWTGPSRPR